VFVALTFDTHLQVGRLSHNPLTPQHETSRVIKNSVALFSFPCTICACAHFSKPTAAEMKVNIFLLHAACF
jgi:hypothetical protein